MWLTRLALKNPILILMLSLMITVLGLVSLRRLSVDLFPEINIPVIRVATFYSGAGPADIEKSITEPVERAVSAAPGVQRVESFSKQGVSVVSVWFDYDVNLDNAQFDVAQRVQQIQNTLPPGIQQPFILKFDITNIPVAQVAVSADGLDEKQLYDLAYNVIEPQIERINGVASATPGGGKIREIQVLVQRDALRSRKLGVLDVVDSVRATNLLLPSGYLRSPTRDYNVFSNTQIVLPKELEDVVLRAPATDAQPVRLGDVARVEDGAQDQAEIVRIDGKRGVFLRVLKQPKANTIDVVDKLRETLPKMQGVPPNAKATLSFDQSTYIRAAVSALEHEALTGSALAILVILIFLASGRATIIVSVSIPLSVVATFILLYAFNQTLNVFTLGGLALGVGRLVDDSIVELENIQRHLDMGKDRTRAVLDAAQEVAMPILVSTLTTIVVFVPVLFLTGVAKNVFLPLALTITFALVMSFFVSRTVTPLLCLYLLRPHDPSRRTISTRLLHLLDRGDAAYGRVLDKVLGHRAITIGVILAGCAAAMLLAPRIGTEFFPETDEGQFNVVFRNPIGSRLETSEEVSKKMEAALAKEMPKGAGTLDGSSIYAAVFSDIGLPAGRTALFTANTGPHSGNINVNLVSKRRRTMTDAEVASKLRRPLAEASPGSSVFISTGGIVKRILNFGAPAPIDVEILGYDLDSGAAYARVVAAKLRQLTNAAGAPILTDVQISREENYPELDVTVDRQKAGVLGVSERDIAQTVLVSLVGSTQVNPVRYTDPKSGNEYFVNVRLDDPYRAKVDDLRDVFLRTAGGSVVSLDTVAKVERSSGPVQIGRKYLQRVIEVTANVGPGVDLGTASVATQKVIDDTPPPDGFTARLGGQTEAQKAAFAGLGFAGLLAIALVYMCLASQFKSLVHPFVIMFSVPLGVAGVVLMLHLTKTTFSVNSAMGVIMMVGIVVSNGVLLVDFANVLVRRGVAPRVAAVEAAKTRLRPILMTTIATVVGLAPVAVGIGEGSETNVPLARAVIGGLTVSTLLTLFLIPTLYTLTSRFGTRVELVAEEGDADAPS